MITNTLRQEALEKEEWIYTKKENFIPKSTLEQGLKDIQSSEKTELEKIFSEYFIKNNISDSITTLGFSELSETKVTAVADQQHFEIKCLKGEFKQSHLFHFETGNETSSFININAEPNSEESLNFLNLYFVIEENSHHKVNLILNEDNFGTRLVNIQIVCFKNATFSLSCVNLGANHEKINVISHQVGSNCQVNYYQNNLLDKNQTSFTNLKFNHTSPHQDSDQLVQYFLTDESKSIFRGSININEKCENVNGAQLNKNILLSRKSSAYSIPSLDVANDQVKCAHGSTTGKIDEEELFYLNSRGINKEKAKSIYLKNQLIKNIFSINQPNITDKVIEKLDRIV